MGTKSNYDEEATKRILRILQGNGYHCWAEAINDIIMNYCKQQTNWIISNIGLKFITDAYKAIDINTAVSMRSCLSGVQLNNGDYASIFIIYRYYFPGTEKININDNEYNKMQDISQTIVESSYNMDEIERFIILVHDEEKKRLAFSHLSECNHDKFFLYTEKNLYDIYLSI